MSGVDKPIQASSSIAGQEKVVARAIDIYEQHSREHGELWKEADPTELGAMVRHKGNRVNYSARRYQEGHNKDKERKRIVDSALDCINYCGFIIRLVEDEEGRDSEGYELRSFLIPGQGFTCGRHNPRWTSDGMSMGCDICDHYREQWTEDELAEAMGHGNKA